MQRLLWYPVLVASVLIAGSAAAEPPPAGGAAEDAEAEPETGTKRAPAPDSRFGHINLGVHGIAVGPAGSMGPNTPSTSLASAGFGFGGWLGMGIGRYGSLQIFGDRTLYFSPGLCSIGCGGSSFSLGIGVAYHPIQGIAFDPWGSFGIAYRQSTFQVTDPNAPNKLMEQRYHGFDIARIAFGGDFYPVPAFGFGPFLEMDLGTNFKRPCVFSPVSCPSGAVLPPDMTDGPRAYAMFQVGVRIAFEPMRKSLRSSAASSAATRPAESAGF